MTTITLPFPDKVLWPNGRPAHWAPRHRASKAARKLAHQETRLAMGPGKPDWQGVHLTWTIHPKTAHGIDDDAPPYALKAYRDGIADALGIDDAHFTASYPFGAPIKGGLVRVTITPAEPTEPKFNPEAIK